MTSCLASSYFLSLLLNLELTDWATVAGQRALSPILSSSPVLWFWVHPTTSSFSNCALGLQVLMLMRQALTEPSLQFPESVFLLLYSSEAHFPLLSFLQARTFHLSPLPRSLSIMEGWGRNTEILGIVWTKKMAAAPSRDSSCGNQNCGVGSRDVT